MFPTGSVRLVCWFLQSLNYHEYEMRSKLVEQNVKELAGMKKMLKKSKKDAGKT